MTKDKRVRLPDSPDSLPVPACVGYFGSPMSLNGPCSFCAFSAICKHVSEKFVAREEVDTLVNKLNLVLKE